VIKMELKIDIRETQERINLAKSLVDESEVVMLEVGDYVFGPVGVEYKEDDFLSSVTGRKMFQQLQELGDNYEYPLLIVGKNLDELYEETINSDSEEKGMHENAFIGTIASMIARGIPPIFLSNKELAMKIMIKSMEKLTDGKDRRINTAIRPTAKVEDYQLAILKSFPLMGSKKANIVLNHFGSIEKFMGASIEEMKEIKGIGKQAEKWYNIIHYEDDEIEW